MAYNLTMRDYCVPCETDINCHVSSRNAFRIQGLFNFGKVSLVKFEILRNFAFVKSNLTLSSAWYIIRNNNAHVFPSLPPSLPFFRFATRRKLTLFQDLPASPNFVHGIEFRTCSNFFFPLPPTPPPLNSRGRVYISENFNFRPVLAHENSSITIENYVEI